MPDFDGPFQGILSVPFGSGCDLPAAPSAETVSSVRVRTGTVSRDRLPNLSHAIETMEHPSMESTVTLRQAYLIMFEFLELQWKRLDKLDAIGALLSNLALWDESNGQGKPMDAGVFPEWLECARRVLQAEQTGGYVDADIRLSP